MEITQITDNSEKQSIARLIPEKLPDWFGIPEARESYITESGKRLLLYPGKNGSDGEI